MRLGLIVDSSSVIRKVARRILEDHDFEVVEAEDGEEALGACQRNMPDLVIVDWKTPTLPGIAFVRALRRAPGGTKPRVVYCSTENDPEQVSHAISSGADQWLLKPFDRDVIAEMLRDLGLTFP
jgi:two-component system chemotaxis response regulator CheY